MSYRKPRRYAYCPRCGGHFGVKRDGTLYKHGRMHQPCSGTNLRVLGNEQTADPVLSRRPR